MSIVIDVDGCLANYDSMLRKLDRQLGMVPKQGTPDNKED